METVKIEYDPYKQQISYEYLGNSGWVALDSASKLKVDKYQQAALQSVSDEVLEKIVEAYATDKKRSVQIIFCGTKEDYDDLSEAVERKKDDPQWNAIIELKKDDTSFYNSASEASEAISGIFKDLQQYLIDYNDHEISKILCQYSDAASNTVPICVIGGYSSGKSMLINALIGEDVLPSGDDPETAQIYKIVRSDRYRIEFTCKDRRLCFEIDETKTVRFAQSSEDTGLCADWIRDLTSVTGDSKAEIMRTILCRLNASAKKQTTTVNHLPETKLDKIAGLITVEVPFHHSTLPNDIHIEIYDTPGSDSASNENHFEVLKDALDERTNGLPILVIKSMDSLDEAGLSPLLRSLKDVMLDTKNCMILVNKADTSPAKKLETLSSKKNLLAIEQNRSCIIPLSALMALGCKRSGPLDSWDDYETFYSNEKKFCDPNDKFYRSLPQYGVYPRVRKESIITAVKTQEDNLNGNNGNECLRKELIAQNSGIRAVESEIAHYVRYRADYNKCKSAAGYLEQAIIVLDKTLNMECEELKKIEGSLRNQREEAKNNLLNALKEKAEGIVKCANEKSVENLKKQDMNIRDQSFNKKQIEDEVKKLCAKYKRDKGFDNLRNSISQNVNSKIKRYGELYGNICTDFWRNQEKEMKNALLRVVMNSNDISDTEREVLKKCILDTNYSLHEHKFSPTKEQLVTPRKFLFFNIGKKLSVTNCTEEIIQHSRKACLAITTEIKQHYQMAFSKFCNELIQAIQNQLDMLNPNLIQINQKLCDCRKRIDDLDGKRKHFEGEIQEIKRILGRQEQEVAE